ncbi:hypothetical protein F5148DRAFT_1301986 [Russula earlei]|uniref:Uncharacterized protein n=1 Tax=Russula earlei TaxID=71964 RepID=A0ACC0UPF8_9AGAM|nr:hypothetical protein F5148DRAFT_1301986 [Russula earlei]
MTSYYPPPQSSPLSVLGRDLPPDPYPRPSSAALLEKIQQYPPDASIGTPSTPQPFQPFPQPARTQGRSYTLPLRPESPAQVARVPPGWPLPRVHEPSTPVQKVHKTFLQWKAEAQATSADYQRNGFPSPVAWVYVEGHDIPPNAIIGGVDRKGPWHIARAFYEGGLELGKAGRHFRLGASISYHGKEREVGHFSFINDASLKCSVQVDAYEVLVEANLPTRWVYQSISPYRPIELPGLSFADFKLVVIVDDSDSMDGPLWHEARDALAGVAELSRLKGGEGLDIYCLNNNPLPARSPSKPLVFDFPSNIKLFPGQSESEVRDFFNIIVPEGQTPIGAKLRQILDYYVPRIEDPILNSKPISILIITDGVPTDDPKSVIVEFARRLDAKNVPLRQLGLQFVQIGDDPDATEALKELDDELGPTHGIRDMVDTTPFRSSEPHLRADALVKIVLGAINSTLDDAKSHSSVLQY